MAKNIMSGHSATPKNGSPKIGPKAKNTTERTPKYVHSSGNNSKMNRSTSAGR
jgi:hypothetical protein